MSEGYVLPKTIPGFKSTLPTENIDLLFTRIDWMIMLMIVIVILLGFILYSAREFIENHKKQAAGEPVLFADLTKAANQAKFKELLSKALVAMEDYKEYADPYWYYGLACYRLGDYEKAQSNFEYALFLSPGFESLTQPYLNALEKIEFNRKTTDETLSTIC